ncbi:MAG: hypothetical protein JHC79_22525 [Williamsia sp.]|nr:hypothetical protein [Williamsia sp.]
MLDPRSAIDACLRAVAEAGLATSMALDRLVAVRLPAGYRVYVRYDPTVSTFASMTIGGPVFYVGDDGVVTRSSGSVAPPVGARRFREEFARRRGYDNTAGFDLWDDDVIGTSAGARPSNAGGN